MKATMWCTSTVPPNIKEVTHFLMIETLDKDGNEVRYTYNSEHKIVIYYKLTREFIKYMIQLRKEMRKELQQN